MANVSDLLDRFVELFNNRQFEEAEKDLASGAVSEEIGTGRRLTPQESTANARAWSQAFPDAKGTITNKIIDGNKGAAEITWRGTNKGSLMGQPATGKSVQPCARFPSPRARAASPSGEFRRSRMSPSDRGRGSIAIAPSRHGHRSGTPTVC